MTESTLIETVETIDAVETTEPTVAATERLTNLTDILAFLAETFPNCFTLQGEAKPLKLDIFDDLAEALADNQKLSKTQLRRALRAYTSNWRYLHGFREGAYRIDLQGENVAPVEAEHIAYAQERLAEGKAKVALKRAEDAKAKVKAKPKKARQTKPANPRRPQRKPQVKRHLIDASQLRKDLNVFVQVGESFNRATVLGFEKDGVRVQLQNGLTLTVPTNRIFG